MITDSGSWDWGRLGTLLPIAILDRIASIPPPQLNLGDGLVPPESQVVFFSLPFKDWLCKNLFTNSVMDKDRDWLIRFAIMCWLLWKHQCRLLLESEVGVMDDVLVHGNWLVRECSRVAIGVRGES
ncbi:hypothetical protein V6N11_018281 [Hibiscus sabdariffa]|uniref:Uncharacterized protein n=1 Tax=Hibiscus sabdariffa TaxID=183260 RepID=A0ABR2T7E5_9ROSI